MPAIDADCFRLLIESAPDAFFVHDVEGHILDVNARACLDLGYTREELLTLTIDDVSSGRTPSQNARHWALIVPGAAMASEQVGVRKDGSTFPVDVTWTCQRVAGRKLFLALVRDLTARREAERQVLQERERLMLAARVGGIGIWDYDLIDDVLLCDAQWYRIMGQDADRPIGSLAQFSAFIHPDDVDRATEVEQTSSRLVESGEDYGIVFRIVRPDGQIRWVRSAASMTATMGGQPRRVVGFVVDITEAHLAEEQLRQTNLSLEAERTALARRSAELDRQTGEDPLTGIANRRRFDQELERACLYAMRTGKPVALAMIDIDFFKLYNDRYGHVQGDAALQAVARILGSAVQRPYDLAARYGGEEFVLLLPATNRPEVVLERIAAQLKDARIAHDASPVSAHVTISCGCVVLSQPARLVARDLIVQADEALYRAKGSGRNRIVIDRLHANCPPDA